VADIDLARTFERFANRLVEEPQLGLALAAQAAVELGVLLLELGLLGIDEVGFLSRGCRRR
jgi:hypothetical protein